MYLYMKIRNHASKTRKEINRLSYINYLHYLPKQATPSLHIFLHKELTSIGRRNIPERFTTDTGIPLTPGHPPVDYRMASLKRATAAASVAASSPRATRVPDRPLSTVPWGNLVGRPPPPLPPLPSPDHIVRPPSKPSTILHPRREICQADRGVPLPPGLSAWLPSITSFGPVLLPCPGPGPGKERQRTEEGDTSTGLYRVGGGHRGLSSRRKVPGLNYPPSGGATFDLGYRDARGKVGEKRAAANHVTPKGGKFSDGYCYGEQRKTGSIFF